MRYLRWLLIPAVVIPLGWLLFTGFGRDPTELTSPLIGQPAPEWRLRNLDGDLVASVDLVGEPYVVNFWASWCIPACVDEHPVLADAYENAGVTVVGMTYQDTVIDAQVFLARYGDAGYEQLFDEHGWVAIDFGVTGPPETYFVDADGIVRAKQFGPLTPELMEEHLATIGVSP
ncbi:MAG TPA: redoxin domain-containing protein [Candidatus Limnocylindria bacterium]|jgi:cytochrome c biogenesis protein CcmG/thiol:disulfide interchange protein DsbE